MSSVSVACVPRLRMAAPDRDQLSGLSNSQARSCCSQGFPQAGTKAENLGGARRLVGLLSPASSIISAITTIGFIGFFVFMLSIGIALLRRRSQVDGVTPATAP